MSSIADLEREYLVASGETETLSLADMRLSFHGNISDPAVLAVYVAESTLTPVASYSKHDHIRSGLEALIAALP